MREGWNQENEWDKTMFERVCVLARATTRAHRCMLLHADASELLL